MSATKDLYIDCLESGVVPVEAKSLAKWAEKLGDKARILSGMPMTHRHQGRRGPVDVDVIPAGVAAMIVDAIPEANEQLGWMLDAFAETYL